MEEDNYILQKQFGWHIYSFLIGLMLVTSIIPSQTLRVNIVHSVQMATAQRKT